MCDQRSEEERRKPARTVSIVRLLRSSPGVISMLIALVAAPMGTRAASADTNPPISLRFHLEQPGFVTLVIDDERGRRVRNLISETPFPAGDHAVGWDGLDDLGRDTKSAESAIYHVPGKAVAPGRYTVRGLYRPELKLRYEITPYSNGQPPWKTKEASSEWLANHNAPSAILFVPENVAPSRKKPAPGGQIIVGSFVSEGGSGVAWLDLNGNKIHGQLWIGGVWTGATQLTRDEGPGAIPGVYAYTGSAWEGELRLYQLLDEKTRGRGPADSRFGTGEDRPVLEHAWKFPESDQAGNEDDKRMRLSGLAVRDGLLVASLPTLNQLLFIDVKERKVLGTAAFNNPRGLAFDRPGRLLALNSNQLLRFSLDRSRISGASRDTGKGPGPIILPKPETVIASALDDAQQIAFDPQGNIFISDHGESHQVKMFNANGRLLRTIGAAGRPRLGPYDPAKMHHPAGITIGSDGNLWVAEDDETPKRISVWKTNGTFLRAFYGPAQYGGGGFLDSEDKSRFFYADEGGTELRIDWERGTAVPVSVYYRHELDPLGLETAFNPGCPPSMPIHHDGRTYLTDAHNNNPTSGWGAAALWILERGIARPVAAMGRPQDWKVFFANANSNAFLRRLPPGAAKNIKDENLMFAWSDLNGDGRPQADEVSSARIPVMSVNVGPDLSFVTGSGRHFKPQWFTAGGAPVYNLANATRLVEQTQNPASSGGNQVLVAREGWSVFTTPPKPFSAYGIAGVRNGEPMWSYPNMWPGLHASHHSPVPEFPGQLIGTTRLLGHTAIFEPRPNPPPAVNAADRPSASLQRDRVRVRDDDTDAEQPGSPPEPIELFAINGNKGTIYLFSTDGLFVATLFQDSRLGGWDFEEAERGLIVNRASLREECFWPTMTQTRDGELWLQVLDGALVRVEGIKEMRRLPERTFEISAAQLVAARDWSIRNEAARQQTNDSAMAIALLETAPVVDGKADEWPADLFASIDTRRVQVTDWSSKKFRTEAALAVSGDRLFACFKTGEPDLVENAGNSWPMHFKTGGGLDLMLGTNPDADPKRTSAVAGDVRLLVAKVDGKPMGVLYRPVAPGGRRERFPFSSPLRTIRFDRVDDVSRELQFRSTVTRNEKEKTQTAIYEFSIPLAAVGLKADEGMAIRGDVGVLRGNGATTFQRSYWRNKSAALTSDIPSEAELLPQLWGTMTFRRLR